MRYFIITIVLLCSFSIRSSYAGFFVCDATLINCLSTEIKWCSYDCDSFWCTLYDYAGGALDAGESSGVACSSESGCYIIAEETDSDLWFCTDYQVDGTVDCNEYACIDGDVSWHSGDSEYSCSDNTCTTD